MDQGEFFMIFSPAWLLLTFLLYWPFFFKSAKVGKPSHILMLRYYGAFIFGGIPIIVTLVLGFSVADNFGLGIDLSNKTWIWVASLLLGLVLGGFNFIATKGKDNLAEYPQIRERSWSGSLYFHNILSWLVYLVGYEFLFRGIMLFPLVPVIGFWPAAVFGTVIYSLSHYPKAIREAVLAVPFGLILAWITWQTQSIWPCIWIHAGIALSNSLFSIYHHPEINLVKAGEQ